MALDSDTKYPRRRTYVVKVRSDAQPDAPVGRVENPDTGQKRNFTSGLELIDAIANDLQASLDKAAAAILPPIASRAPKPTEE